MMGVQRCRVPLELSMTITQRSANQSTSKPCITTLGHIFKRCSIIPQGHLLNYVHGSFICNSKNLETTDKLNFLKKFILKITHAHAYRCLWRPEEGAGSCDRESQKCESPDVSIGYSGMGVSGVCYCVGAGNIIKCS